MILAKYLTLNKVLNNRYIYNKKYKNILIKV